MRVALSAQLAKFILGWSKVKVTLTATLSPPCHYISATIDIA